jgi:pyrimidine-specific ribonucleoside hydrolase
VVTTEAMHVDVELGGSYTRGRTVADSRGRKDMPANVDVGTGIDRDRFLEILYESLG